MAQCTAKSKRTGERCRRAATPGRTVCYYHGGRTLAGVASGTFKHGRYSKVLPGRLLERYQEALTDHRLLELAEEIALIDARLRDVLTRVDTGESGRLWRQLKQTHEEMLEARQAGDVAAMAQKLNALGQMIERGLADWAAWEEIERLLEQRRRFVESERRRMVEMQQMITAERAMVLLAFVVDVIRRHVSDRRILAAISADIGKLVASQAGGGVETSGDAPGPSRAVAVHPAYVPDL